MADLASRDCESCETIVRDENERERDKTRYWDRCWVNSGSLHGDVGRCVVGIVLVNPMVYSMHETAWDDC